MTLEFAGDATLDMTEVDQGDRSDVMELGSIEDLMRRDVPDTIPMNEPLINNHMPLYSPPEITQGLPAIRVLRHSGLSSGSAASALTWQSPHRFIGATLIGLVLIVVIACRAMVGPSSLPVSGAHRGASREFLGDAENKAAVTDTELLEFYVYHLQGRDAPGKDPFEDESDIVHAEFGNVNVGNIDAVLWYLLDDVVRTDTGATLCPKRHAISAILRRKIRVRTTQDLAVGDMHMGGLFAYENGVCKGLCSANGACTGNDDCEAHYINYGYAPGCSTTVDKPFPSTETPHPGVVWYSLPLAGRCTYPTGDYNCTWSYEDAGQVNLELVEASSEGKGYCCYGLCTSFWNDPRNATKHAWRKAAVFDMFEMMYPEQSKTLNLDTECDVKWSKWYGADVPDEFTSPPTQAVKTALRSMPNSTTTGLSTSQIVTTTTEVMATTTRITTTISQTTPPLKATIHEDVTLPSEYDDDGSAPDPVSSAPIREFYVYRAMAGEADNHETLGNINVANLDGVIWYLQSEVANSGSKEAACPRKSAISSIRRYRIRTRAPAKVFDQGMNMGMRFAFNLGKCLGRCFPKNMCTGQDDCAFHYERYGFTPGCNNFHDKYPFPDFDTSAPGGIFYSLPVNGRCDYPTGANDCTWSYDEAGVLSLSALEAEFPSQGQDDCCSGLCSDFWKDPLNTRRTSWRVNQTLDVFKKVYPRMPRDLDQAQCDFDHTKWYHGMGLFPRLPWNESKVL